jgi:transcriptional regulator with XRE-family HTH domain
MTLAELRRARMAQGLSLTEISRRTRIGVGHLRKIEDGDLKGLPPGFYARAFVRAYAEAVGVDSELVLGRLTDQLPAAETSAVQPEQTALPYVDAASIIPNARMQVFKQLLERHDRRIQTDRHVRSTAMKAPARGPRRFLAAWVDLLLLATIYASVLAITAFACDVRITELVAVSGAEVFTVLALITMLYILLMGGIAGRTIGAMLLHVPLIEGPRRPLDLRAIVRRSFDCVRADVSAAAELASFVERIFVRARRAA